MTLETRFPKDRFPKDRFPKDRFPKDRFPKDTDTCEILEAMEITIATPALLFPTISLLMLAYTNRFLALTSAVRKLLEQYRLDHQTGLLRQIHALRFRINLIKYMQTIGVSSLFLCVLCMAALFAGLVCRPCLPVGRWRHRLFSRAAWG